MATKTLRTAAGTDRHGAREKLLAAANELFYEEGVHTVGIDRVIERAGVAKASLYNTFGSKDELIRAYLAQRHESRRARTLAVVDRFETPRQRLLAVFDAQAEWFARPGFRGCAFVNASAESTPGSSVEIESGLSRSWMLNLLTDLARAAGAADPGLLARQLVLLYDGATVSASMDRNLAASGTARAMAETVIDAATVREHAGAAAR